jgi:methylthioribose-1-phosphate isomerase
MVVAPTSTIDLNTTNGARIPLEQRPSEELLEYRDFRIAPSDLDAYNPVFDITPAELVDLLVTERGVIERPNRETIQGLFRT